MWGGDSRGGGVSLKRPDAFQILKYPDNSDNSIIPIRRNSPDQCQDHCAALPTFPASAACTASWHPNTGMFPLPLSLEKEPNQREQEGRTSTPN